MSELPLSDLVPLWRTLRESEVTALVTPALDYVGGLELSTVDVRFVGDDQIATLGEGLRSLVSSLEDDCTLLFLYRVSEDLEGDIRDYEGACQFAEPRALRVYSQARARWLRQQPLRRARLYLFFSRSPAKGTLSRGFLGQRLLFVDPTRVSTERHQRELRGLAQLRDQLGGQFASIGLQSRELSIEDVWLIHHELLNPTLAGARERTPQVSLKTTLWDEMMIRRDGEHHREYTEAEQLCREDLVDAEGHLRQGETLRRVTTLKVMPESGTGYFATEPLLSLVTQGTDGQERPFGYSIAVAVHVQPQGRTRWLLNAQHGLVDALKNAIPFLADKSVGREASDRAKQQHIEALFDELTRMSSKLVSLSVSLLLEADTIEELDRRTVAARSAFSKAGNSEMLREDVAQLPAFLSMFPGSGPYQLRKKGCTSRNAGDFLPVFAPWRGCSRASSLLLTPSGEAFRFDLFDKKLATAHHGLVVADTGSGKSVSLGALTLDALAAGVDAILIDNGNSWKQLTELMGGTHISVDLKTSICPFLEYERIVDSSGRPDNEAIQDAVQFLEVCVSDRGQPPFDKLETDVVARAIQRCYEERFRGRPQERPVISHFRDALVGYQATHADDRAILERISRRLALYCDGIYADLLNRPSALRFDARLLTFDLQNVGKSPTTKTIAMATIIQAITNRAAARKNRTLVEVDEGHEHLGADDVGERFLAGCYRKMRKFDVAMWMISQRFQDFLSCKAGPAIVGNSKIRIFLRHDGGHDDVIDYFKLPPRAADAFRRLALRPGHYSDFLLLYGQMTTTVRLALHPLAYWLLTTDPEDRTMLQRAVEKNPLLDRLTVLRELAARFPHGAGRASPRGAA